MLRIFVKDTAIVAAWLAAVLLAMGQAARAENAAPHPGTVTIETQHGYQDLVSRLDTAVKGNEMGLVTRASATKGAASLGKTIPGNMVVGVFRPDFAIRMLEASTAAGIEAPLRFYITENVDGTANLTYRKPTAVFAPYEVPALDEMAKELDAIFEKIAADATGN